MVRRNDFPAAFGAFTFWIHCREDSEQAAWLLVAARRGGAGQKTGEIDAFAYVRDGNREVPERSDLIKITQYYLNV